MPRAVEEALARAAERLSSKGKLKSSKKYKSLHDAKNAFIYGNMRKMGYPVGRGSSGKGRMHK